LHYRPALIERACSSGGAPVRLIDREMIYSGWGRFLLLQVELRDGRLVQRQVEDHGEAAAVLPYDAERKMALVVRQPRVGPLYSGFEPHLVEAAAGVIDPGETAAAAAMREALEELGVRLLDIESVAAAWSMPGVSSERIHLFLAPYSAADRVAAGGGVADEGEEIEVLELPLRTLVQQADAGALTDIKTLALVWALARRRPELFV
jgi:nudix-type nucleoside diphosphatase (YffH/AdpP family)